MVDIKVDMSEVEAFAVDLGRLPAELSRHAIPVMKRAAQNIKTEIQADMRGSSNAGFRKAAGHVSYDDISDGADGFETEIGFDKEGAGNLANLAIYGSHKGGGTHEPPERFAEAEMPEFESQVSALVDRIWP